MLQGSEKIRIVNEMIILVMKKGIAMARIDNSRLLQLGVIPVLDPISSKEPSNDPLFDPSSFLAEYGELLQEISIIAKSETGRVAYRSMVAPVDPKYNEYFENFANIASQLDISVTAVVHSFGDEYFAQQEPYRAYQSGYRKSYHYVCPRSDRYIRYLSTLVREITRFPVKEIMLLEFYYPLRTFCFCRRCNKDLREEFNMEFDISLDDLKDPYESERYEEFRAQAIMNALEEIVNVSELSTLDEVSLGLVIPIDPLTKWSDGLMYHFGINIRSLSNVSWPLRVIFQPFPFQRLLPGNKEIAWTEFFDNVAAIKQILGSRIPTDLFFWNLRVQDIINFGEILLKINSSPDLGIDKVYGNVDEPLSFKDKRKIYKQVSEES